MPPVYMVPRARACQNCAALKVRCEPHVGYAKCKRCHNQGLACAMQVTERRKRRRTHASAQSGGEMSDVRSNPCTLFEIERGMRYYRTALFKFFPFIIAPDVNCSAAEFEGKKPFLALVVGMLGCTKDRARQRDLIVHTRTHVAVHMIQNGEKSLDLLQGLLLLVHWSHLQLELRSQRSVFMHMAMSLLVDLELDRSPFSRRYFVTATEGADAVDLRTERRPDQRADHTFEEKRAFLACVYLSSVLSNSSVNLSAVRFSDYAEWCCAQLEKSELETDHTLVSLCRLQHAVEQFRAVTCWFYMGHRQRDSDSVDIIYDIFRRTSSTEGLLHHVRSWDAIISAQWNAIPECTKTKLLAIQYGYARVCLYECCLDESLFHSSEARLEVARNCVSAIKFLNDALIPVSDILLDVPAHIFAQSSHNTLLAVLLCSLKSGDPAAEFVSRELNLRDYFAGTLDRLKGLLAGAPEDEIPELYKKLIPRVRGLQKWFAAKSGGGEDVQNERREESSPCAPGSELDADFCGQFLNLDGDQWLHDILDMDHLESNFV